MSLVQLVKPGHDFLEVNDFSNLLKLRFNELQVQLRSLRYQYAVNVHPIEFAIGAGFQEDEIFRTDRGYGDSRRKFEIGRAIEELRLELEGSQANVDRHAATP